MPDKTCAIMGKCTNYHKEKIMNIYQLIQQQKAEQQRRFGNFLFETLKAFHNDCMLRNPDASVFEKLHASAELGKYFGKYIRREY